MAKATKKKKKTTPKKAKRLMSAKQKAALKKGQAALKRWRAQQKKSSAPKKKTTRKSTRKSTVKKRVSKVKTPAKRSVSIKRKSGGGKPMITKKISRGISKLARKSNALEMLKDSGLVIFAGITSGYLVSKIPISDSRVRSLIPVGAGIGLAALTSKSNKIARGVSQGMVILGTVSLFKQLAPGVPMLAGERIILLPTNNGMGRRLSMSNSGRATLGRRVRLAGNSVVPYRTAANT